MSRLASVGKGYKDYRNYGGCDSFGVYSMNKNGSMNVNAINK